MKILSVSATLAVLAMMNIKAVAADAPPTVAQIKQCVEQMDTAAKGRFLWKEVKIGPPRLPRDNYEAMDLWGWQSPRRIEGYPVHVVYSFAGLANVDKEYWIIRNESGKWQIPLLCTLN